MNKKNTFFILLAFAFLQLPAQQKLITCTTEKNPDNTYSIYAENEAYTDYTVKLIFSTLLGYTSTVERASFRTVGRGKTQIAKLTIDKSASGFSFSYTYQYFAGTFLRKTPDTSFVYLMPSTPENSLHISKVTSIAERLGQKNTEDFHSIGFKYKLGDTICASRGGIVFECKNDVKEGEKKYQIYSDNRNKISIAQKDGTLAYYLVLAHVKLLVAPGDKVIPGQPLAVFDKESEKYNILFSVYYLDEKKLFADRDINIKEAPVYHISLPTVFYMSNTDKTEFLQMNKVYKVQHPTEIIAAEMSKKEKRKIGL